MALFPATDPAKKTPGRRRHGTLRIWCVGRCVRSRNQYGDQIGVLCDVALDPYSSHGQDGLVEDGYVVNDPTVEALCKQSRGAGASRV